MLSVPLYTMASPNLPGALHKKLSELEQSSIEEQAKIIAQKNGFPYLKVSASLVNLKALALISEADSRSAEMAVIAENGQTLRLVTTHPSSPAAKRLMDELTAQRYTLQINVVSRLSLEKIWERYAKIIVHATEDLGTIDIDNHAISQAQQEIKNIADLKNKLVDLPTTQLLEVLVVGAIKTGASDIHLEPEEKTVRARYRLDGILSNVVEIDLASYARLLSRLKVISGLKINIHHTPQDGRFSVKYGAVVVEIRTSVLPGSYGENVVMRVLDPSSVKQTIEDLGLSRDNTQTLKQLLKKTTGAILITGPTGAGKTTTLYAFVQHINEPGIKIITIEDPVEYHLVGISQTQVNPSKGYTFANGLRSIVRQDPDIILIGEIRDGETAEIAMQAALTGHLVFSTLHTNDAAGAIPRLIDLGAKPASIAPAINAVIAQRLVRKLCQYCAKKGPLKKEDGENLRSALPAVKPPAEIFYPSQCAECNFTGYEGRLGIFELFVMDIDLERFILKSPAISEMRELAIKKGMTTMLQDGYLKVLEGTTSFEEVRRVLA